MRFFQSEIPTRKKAISAPKSKAISNQEKRLSRGPMSLRGGGLGAGSSAEISFAISAAVMCDGEKFCALPSESRESGGMTSMLYRCEICRKNYLAVMLTRKKVYEGRTGNRAGQHRQRQPTRGDPAASADLAEVSHEVLGRLEVRGKVHAFHGHGCSWLEFPFATGFQIDDVGCHAPMLIAGKRILRVQTFALVRKSQLTARK